MEHTNEFLQMMHCAYMGCNVIDTKADRVGKVISANTTRVWYEHPNNKINSRPTQSFAFYGECKPILTPLSEITDEDAVEVAKIIYGDEFLKKYSWDMSRANYPNFVCLNNIDDDDYSIIFTVAKDFKNNICIEAFMPNNQHTTMFYVVDYLRSKHYDCGYMHIPSLIEAGLAVKATK